mmetsp:Transcript_55080/g.146348  ORF Transcript_55080/g.146348 Transcript_55080/m.146348 type:complete len:259 (-) Transcript_55080:261-1037(-)
MALHSRTRTRRHVCTITPLGCQLAKAGGLRRILYGASTRSTGILGRADLLLQGSHARRGSAELRPVRRVLLLQDLQLHPDHLGDVRQVRLPLPRTLLDQRPRPLQQLARQRPPAGGPVLLLPRRGGLGHATPEHHLRHPLEKHSGVAVAIDAPVDHVPDGELDGPLQARELPGVYVARVDEILEHDAEQLEEGRGMYGVLLCAVEEGLLEPVEALLVPACMDQRLRQTLTGAAIQWAFGANAAPVEYAGLSELFDGHV